ncbi:hypothetical protein KF134_1247 [Lactococcus lactis subsp. lactis]|uniref:hypothetical protein n=1 Tax=Lactococcus lactis TaxID=1358 RepID=UPI00071D6049|nr:hypothetical protein [Lactococcus lactis]KST91473.1 hypothetical protein KF134_1247 [Lactococcus lactis subsp. lactis]
MKKSVLLTNIPYKTEFEHKFWDYLTTILDTKGILVIHIGRKSINPNHVLNYDLDKDFCISSFVDDNETFPKYLSEVAIRYCYKENCSLLQGKQYVNSLYKNLSKLFEEREVIASLYWGNTEPISIIAHEISNAYQILNFEVERSPINDHLWIDPEGIFNDKSIRKKIPPKIDDYYDAGYQVVENLKSNIYGFRKKRYKKNEKYIKNKLKVFLPLDNVIESAWLPREYFLSRERYKFYESPLELLDAISNLKNIDVIVGSHPSCSYLNDKNFSKYKNIRLITDYDLEYYIKKADIVLCGHTKVAFVAASFRKSMYLFTDNIISLCGYGKKFKDHLINEGVPSKGYRCFINYCGWLSREYFYTLPDGENSRIEELINNILEKANE